MLWLPKDGGPIEHVGFRDLLHILQPGDLLVLNDTRVTARRLFGRRPSGGAVELLLLRDLGEGRFEAMARPGRRLKPGARVHFDDGLEAEFEDRLEGPIRTIRFLPVPDLEARIQRIGQTPLPPYVKSAIADPERYQTVYAQSAGSAAAPTAGLHFTPEFLSLLKERGVDCAFVTLNVSIDTFRPVESDDLGRHVMHGETATITPEAAAAIRACHGRIVAVGTTVVRTLESFATGPRQVDFGTQSTRLFIRPGFQFRIVDGMLTNFHLPRTTMLMMIAAMAGRDRVLDAYREALARDYRFLSFGDAMLIL